MRDLRALRHAATAVLVMGVAGCGGGDTTRIVGPPTVIVKPSRAWVRSPHGVTFTAKSSEGSGCPANYVWDLNGDGFFDDAAGKRASYVFRGHRRHVVAAEFADCPKSVPGAVNVWTSPKPRPAACPAGKPFDLVTTSATHQRVQDANGLPLDPEWHWQCNYAGFRVGDPYPETYGDPNRACNDFAWDERTSTFTPGSNCASHLKIDAPRRRNNALWYRICHFSTDAGPTFQDNTPTLHGHVNWRPVTFRGAVKLERIQQDFPLGDGDVDMNLVPGATQTQQNYTHTLPGITSQDVDRGVRLGETPSIHLEFKYDEVMEAFRAAQSDHHVAAHRDDWARTLLALGGTADTAPDARRALRAEVIGLMGLDVRHGGYTELHPLYAMAVETAVGPGYAVWLVFARNSGTEGGCSGMVNQHRLNASRLELGLTAPSRGLVYDSSASYFEAAGGAAQHTVPRDGRTITLGLPHRGEVVAGKVVLRSPGTRVPRSVERAVGPLVVPARPPEQLDEPEDYLARLSTLPAAPSAADVLSLAPELRRPQSAAQACDRWRGEGSRALPARGVDKVETALVRQICVAAGRPF